VIDPTAHPHLSIHSDGAIRVVTISRPEKLNAVNASLHHSFATLWRELRADRDAKVVVLTGAGPTFCAGGDFDYIDALHDDQAFRDYSADEGGEILLEMLRFPVPVIAAVNGPAVGLGCSLAIMADVVLLSDGAHLADPHVALGLVAGDGGAAMWPLLTSVLRAKEYLYTGDRILPERAVSMGLATRVVPATDLLDEAMRLARRLAAQPAQALQDTKRAINAGLLAGIAGPLQVALAAERISLGSAESRAILRKLAERATGRPTREPADAGPSEGR
jgi:enoyl-CoA hydratase